MRIPARQFRLVSVAALLAVLTACGHSATKLAIDDRAPVTTATSSTMTTTTTIDKNAVERWNVAVWNNAVWLNAVKHAEAAVRTATSSGVHPRPAVVSANIADVMACIRAHESGNYNEHSHASGSSGAYQYEPQTWAVWSARAGYPGYALAYLAPPAVQDAVTAYTLTHGGAHNWDPSFGNDPCTVGMP